MCAGNNVKSNSSTQYEVNYETNQKGPQSMCWQGNRIMQLCFHVTHPPEMLYVHTDNTEIEPNDEKKQRK